MEPLKDQPMSGVMGLPLFETLELLSLAGVSPLLDS